MRAAFFKQKKHLALIIAFCGCILVSAALFFVFNHLGNVLLSQQAASRYRGENEERFAQVSAYFPVGKEIDENTVYSFRQTLDSKMTEASIEAEGNESLYDDAYSASGEITVTGEKGTATVTAIGIGGDYFLFHPLYLRSGNYFSGNDLMHDYVILDEELAWRLFGGIDLAGLTVTINYEPYVIAGVISREDDFASEKAYTSGAGIFMSYDKLNALTGAEISTYELVCINPIEGFALSALEESFASAFNVENSSRFTISGIFDVIKDFAGRSMNTAGVVLPYWENAARYIENIAAIVLIFAVLFAVFPFVTLIVVFVRAVKRLFRAAKTKLPELIEEQSERRYRRKIERRGE